MEFAGPFSKCHLPACVMSSWAERWGGFGLTGNRVDMTQRTEPGAAQKNLFLEAGHSPEKHIDYCTILGWGLNILDKSFMPNGVTLGA